MPRVLQPWFVNLPEQPTNQSLQMLQPHLQATAMHLAHKHGLMRFVEESIHSRKELHPNLSPTTALRSLSFHQFPSMHELMNRPSVSKREDSQFQQQVHLFRIKSSPRFETHHSLNEAHQSRFAILHLPASR